MLFDAHTRCFAALGGVARRGIYDNMKTAVDRVGRGKCRGVNSRFAALCAHYLFDPDFCNVASGWEKGAEVLAPGVDRGLAGLVLLDRLGQRGAVCFARIVTIRFSLNRLFLMGSSGEGDVFTGINFSEKPGRPTAWFGRGGLI